MKPTDTKIKSYIASIDEKFRDDVETLHKEISKHMPSVKPKLWEGLFWAGSEQKIIGYGEISYTRSDKKHVEWFMVGLTAQKNYISVYINGTDEKQYLVKKHGKKLGKAKLGSSSVSFKSIEDIKLDELLKLVDLSHEQYKKGESPW